MSDGCEKKHTQREKILSAHEMEIAIIKKETGAFVRLFWDVRGSGGGGGGAIATACLFAPHLFRISHNAPYHFACLSLWLAGWLLSVCARAQPLTHTVHLISFQLLSIFFFSFIYIFSHCVLMYCAVEATQCSCTLMRKFISPKTLLTINDCVNKTQRKWYEHIEKREKKNN